MAKYPVLGLLLMEDEFVKLISLHSRHVFGFILALSGNVVDAEDIFQNTNVALWKKRESYVGGTNFRAWACKIAYYEVLESRRKHDRDRKVFNDSAFDALATLALDEANAQLSGSREEALARCLEKLPKADRKLIERRYFDALTPGQIAQRTARKVHTIYRALARIHDMLFQCVNQSLVQDQD